MNKLRPTPRQGEVLCEILNEAISVYGRGSSETVFEAKVDLGEFALSRTNTNMIDALEQKKHLIQVRSAYGPTDVVYLTIEGYTFAKDNFEKFNRITMNDRRAWAEEQRLEKEFET